MDDISQKVLQKILAELLEDEDELHELLIKQCNLYAKEIGLGTQTFCQRFWGLVERIIKVCDPLGDDKKLAGILFVLGLPNCTPSEIEGDPRTILSRRVLSSTKRPSIASHIYAKGINQSFEDWIDNLVEEEDLSKALESCRDHFFAGGNDSANFNDDPSIIMVRTRTIISFLTGSLYLQQRCGKKFLVLSLLPHKKGELFYLVLQTGKRFSQQQFMIVINYLPQNL